VASLDNDIVFHDHDHGLNQCVIIKVSTIHWMMLENQMLRFRRVTGKRADHVFNVFTHIFVRTVINDLIVVVYLKNCQLILIVQRAGNMAKHLALLPAIHHLTATGTEPTAHLIPWRERFVVAIAWITVATKPACRVIDQGMGGTVIGAGFPRRWGSGSLR